MISVAVVDQQAYVRLPKRKIKEAVQVALESAGCRQGRITVALIDDASIQQLNRQFLQHDEPTDVLSFPMGRDGRTVEGEIAVSAERAAAVAGQYGWSPEEELLLYVIHGALHLVGFDDGTPTQRQRMRQQETLCLRRLGVVLPTDQAKSPPTSNPSSRRALAEHRPPRPARPLGRSTSSDSSRQRTRQGK